MKQICILRVKGKNKCRKEIMKVELKKMQSEKHT